MNDKAQLFIHYWRMLSGLPEPESEYNFDAAIGRKHRFDFAFPDSLIAVEVEGNAWNVKGGGRHMQNSDLEKYNIAASMGWRVFRFSPSMLKNEPDKCVQTVLEAVCLTKSHLSSDVDIYASVDVVSEATTRITPLYITSRKAGKVVTHKSTTPVILSSSITRNTSIGNLTPAHGGKSSGKSKSKDTAKRK